MASCTKCGGNLIAQARFCAACGSPVTSASVAPGPPTRKAPDPAAADPFARTVFGDGAGIPAHDAPAAAVSPMAASVMQSQSRPPPAPAAAPPAASPAPSPRLPPPAAPAPPVAAPYAAPAPQPSHYFAPGALVLVYWADGNRYPGTVLQIAQHHVFVAFPNGMQQWVDARYVQSGS